MRPLGPHVRCQVAILNTKIATVKPVLDLFGLARQYADDAAGLAAIAASSDHASIGGRQFDEAVLVVLI